MNNIKGQSWKERGQLESPGGVSLSREYEEGIYLLKEGEIPIYISSTTQDKIKLALSASPDYIILRGEILKRRLPKIHQKEITERKPVTSELLKALQKPDSSRKLERTAQ